MTSALFNSFKANDPYELLISQIVQIESQPLYVLDDKRADQERFKKTLNDFDSNVSALHTLMTSFTDVFASPFDARASALSSETGFTVSSTDEAALGSHTMQVERLASTDTRISQQYAASGTSLRSFFDTNGSQSFQINVASPTEADPDNRVAIDVTVDPTGSTDEDILREISDAVATAMNDAVDAGTISDEEAAQSSVVNETTDTARLSLRSGQTGYANRLDFSDSANGLLGLLEVNTAAVASGTGGGQVTDVGTSETTSSLNSKFMLDGLTLYRSSNQVSDALDGITLDLKETMTSPVDFNIGPDTEGIKGQITDFIEKYNSVLSFIEGKTQVDGDLQIRADFAGDLAFTSLRYGMRSEISAQVAGQPSGAPSYLTELGIEIEDNGTLKLADAEALTNALEDDPSAIESLFAGTDGIATRLLSRLDSYTGTNGIIDNRIDSIDDRISRYDNRISDFEDRMSIRENQLREQFARLQEAMAAFQGQSQFIGSLFF